MSENNSLSHPKEVEVFLVKRRPSLVLLKKGRGLLKRVFTQNVVSLFSKRSDISRFHPNKIRGRSDDSTQKLDIQDDPRRVRRPTHRRRDPTETRAVV